MLPESGCRSYNAHGNQLNGDAMATEVYLVKVGMNMTEGIVEEWYIADGGKVAEGEMLYRLESEMR